MHTCCAQCMLSSSAVAAAAAPAAAFFGIGSLLLLPCSRGAAIFVLLFQCFPFLSETVFFFDCLLLCRCVSGLRSDKG